ncbi:non-ribosomal peptide synthetase [Streptomyces filamentosus]|uniref:non-ribosomal peptide synthetase n=1 Tax=Streptomyces filamentosus TaxID=67294 RepID=UPI001238EABA|nr:non-ribosomal peptide synthetase [Streptomyces filamentosus]KAA6215832.1 amino acid adenylation domain-containing protein [Streptomyces filamentosus]
MSEVLSPPDRVPASPAQQGVWLTDRLGLAREAFHMPVRISFDRVDTAALARAVDAVVGRHPSLAARLVERGGRVRQEPAARRPELASLEAPADEAELEKVLEEEAARPFVLETGPLSRFALYRRVDGSAELLVTAHHSVFDGNSKDVLTRDLAAAYRAAPLPAPPSTPAAPPAADPDTVRKAAEWYGPRWAAATEPVLPGAPRTPAAAGAGEAVEWHLEGPAARELAAAASLTGTTVFEFLLAALHALLRRYGGEAVPVSVPFSTRTSELRDEIGMFVNELPVHAPAAGASPDGAPQTFAVFASAVRAELRGGYPYRGVPFGSVVAGLGPRVGLTAVSLGYRRRGPDPDFTGTGARIAWAVHNRTARNTLHLQIVEAPGTADGPGAPGRPGGPGGPGGRLDFSLQYDPAVLAPDTARRIAGHYRTLLDGAVTAPGTPLPDLPLLDAAELRAVTTGPNATERPYPADRTVLDLVRDRAAATPGAIAVSAVDRRLGYRELMERTDQLAGALRAGGVRPGDLVALHLGRTADLPAALLATLAAGAAYLPLDPGYPAERLALVLRDSGAVLVLTDRELPPAVADAAPAVLRLPAPSAQDPAGAASEPGTAPGPDDVAYVLYTSGSTGRPKGVAVGHRALVNLLTSFADRLGSGPGDAWLGLTSLSFDISALELYLPLVTGGRLVLAPDGLAVDGPGLLALIGTEGVTHVQATPSGWRVMLAAGPGTAALAAVTALAGGEALPLPLARDLRARTARLFNVYGPTETTIWSTCAELPARPERVGIGRPIANTQVYVVDERLNPAPLGIPGELLIGGDGVAHGYLGRPGLTADRFVPNPFGPPGTRLYRTGDQAVRTPEGALEFLGRIDDQVKIRGHRIEPVEIESALLEHPAVAQAAVAVHTEEDGEPFLAGYLVPADGAPPAASAELRDHLLRTLPAAMVPQRWLTVDRLPLTPNGKLDRRALPVPAREAPAPRPADTDTVAGTGTDETGGAEGTDETLRTVLRIWAEVLDLPGVGPQDDLFDLGGHSLTVVRIASRIRDALGVEVEFDVFFDVPTPAGIAAAVRARQ